MKKRLLYKIIRDTKFWKKGQKVWNIFGTGQLASYVIGKYKGNGRWIKGWIRYSLPDENFFPMGPANAKLIGYVYIDKKFYKYLESLSGG